MARNTSTAHVIITMDGKQAVNLMTALQRQAKQTREELEAMEQQGLQGSDDFAKKAAELKSMESAIRANRSAYINLKEIVENLSGITLGKLQRALKECRKQMNNMTENDPRFRELSAQYQAIDNQIGRMTGQWHRQDGAIKSVIKRFMAYVSVYGGFNLISSQITRLFANNLKFSDSLADIQKTSGLSAESINQLSDSLMKIDSRSSVEDIHKLAYEAGKLGIGAKYGSEGIEQFVKAADQINVALGEDLGGTEAITQLMKMNEVMGLIKKMGVEKSLLATGSAMNLLSQSTTSTASYMTDYAKRLSGIASQAHLTMSELLGFGSAADATGQEVEVAATAMNKFIVQLQTHYRTVAQAAGISADGLHKMLEGGKTAEAAVMVLRALGEKGGLSQIAPLMKDMGSDGARLTASLATLASNIDLVESSLAISKQGFEEATSVTSEYNIKNENAAAIMERMKNSWEKMFINQSNTGVVKDLAQDFFDLSKELQTNKLLIWEVKVVFTLLMAAVKALVALAPALGVFLSIKGWIMLTQVIRSQLIPGFVGLGGVLKGMFTSMTAATAGVNGMTRAWKLLNLAMKSNVFIGIASILLTVVMSIRSFKKEADDATLSSNNLNKSFRDYTRTSSAASIEVNQLFARLKNTTKGTKEHTDAIIAINKNYSKYLPFLITEKTSLEDIEKAQSRVNDELRKSIAYKAKNAAMDEVGTQYTNRMADNLSNIQEVYNKADIGKLGNLDINYITEAAARYRDAGYSYNNAVEAVWKDLYYKGGKSFDLVKNGGPLSNQWKDIQNNMKGYVANYYNQQKAMKDIGKKYDPLIGDYLETEEPQTHTIIEDEKESEKEKKRKEALRLAKGEYQAAMSAIEVYYKQQAQVVNDSYIDKKITTEQREQELDNIELRHLQSRIEARKKLHGDKDEDWGGNLQKMQSENLSKSEDSQRVLLNLLDKDLGEIGRKLRQFGEAEDDGIWSKLEEDKLKLQKHAIDLRKEIEKILLEYDFTGKVTNQYQNELERLGLFFTSFKEDVNSGFKDANAAAEAGMKALRGMGTNLFSIDINSENGMATFRNMISDTEVFGVQMLNLTDDNYKALYYKTIEYNDAITESEKKARDRQLKIASERYSRSDAFKTQKETGTKDERMVDMSKSVQSLGLGTDTMVIDQEVLMYTHRLEAAVAYYEYLKTNGYDTEQQQLKVQEAVAALSEKMVEQVKEKMEQLKDYTGSIETFGNEFGAGIFGSLDERQKALENFVRSTGEATNKLIMQWVKQKIEHALLRKAMVDTEEDSNEEINDVDKKGNKKVERVEKTMAKAATKRTRDFIKDKISIKKEGASEEALVEEESQSVQEQIVTEGGGAIGKAVIDIGQQVGTAKKTQAAENVGTQATETAAEVPLGIASGASKTIGELGWWGIPLVAVITALLGGLLSTAMSGVSSLFGGKEAAVGVSTSTKLATGMLTYDCGNVQRFSGVLDGKSFPVLGDDGQVYQATNIDELKTGIVNNPITAMVNGQPSIIAEKGPEIIIGSKTTSAMMMSRPDLLAAIVNFDKNRSGMSYRAYDRGNVQDVAGGFGMDGYRSNGDELIEKLASSIMQTLAPTLSELGKVIHTSNQVSATLADKLTHPIPAVINKNGKGGLIEEVIDGLSFAKKNNTSDKLNRLLK
ncbi:phage tail tape measure protein [Bacteroides sp.]|uniref:phage tail tape measure protein n=1 Tax=Bacteroides sp. TaxID=29523 RepID=UPI00261E7E4D|nr:phage tail tape measure protein [Bacteroides sp.]MDD3038906.1 phage tail tape measure protein [Bacteroides sp.]